MTSNERDRRLRVIGSIVASLLLIGCSTPQPPTIEQIGSRREVLEEGRTEARMSVAEAVGKADVIGIGSATVHRIWRAHGLTPHRIRNFKLSNDPRFAEKLKDVIGLYVEPPAHAIVLSLDEKSQIQALYRTQPGLPMKKRRCARASKTI